MITFCPACSNMLQVAVGPSGNRFECGTCAYVYPIEQGAAIYNRKYMERKQIDDILGGEGSWDNVDQTSFLCPQSGCEGDRAYFYQLQIRSADEPMTTFYKCTKCGHQSREN